MVVWSRTRSIPFYLHFTNDVEEGKCKKWQSGAEEQVGWTVAALA